MFYRLLRLGFQRDADSAESREQRAGWRGGGGRCRGVNADQDHSWMGRPGGDLQAAGGGISESAV